ncbi:hypothetical protein J6590_012531 [Homalodisca vitripennis]|nr:hypothetical protein J6590_012531 [Homalodisca vitripennis]
MEGGRAITPAIIESPLTRLCLVTWQIASSSAKFSHHVFASVTRKHAAAVLEPAVSGTAVHDLVTPADQLSGTWYHQRNSCPELGTWCVLVFGAATQTMKGYQQAANLRQFHGSYQKFRLLLTGLRSSKRLGFGPRIEEPGLNIGPTTGRTEHNYHKSWLRLFPE